MHTLAFRGFGVLSYKQFKKFNFLLNSNRAIHVDNNFVAVIVPVTVFTKSFAVLNENT